jgi:hypothetical protein
MCILLGQSVLLILRLSKARQQSHRASAASENGMRLWGSNCFISEAGTHALCPSPQTIINTCQTFPFFTHPISMKSPSLLFNPAAFLLHLISDYASWSV